MIGISSPTFSFVAFDQILDAIVPEFKLWEIVAEFEHNLNKVGERISYAMNSYNIKFQVHAPIADMNIGSPAEPQRSTSLKELLLIVDSCDKLGIEMLTIHPGMAIAYGNEIKDRVTTATRSSILEIDKHAKERNIEIALENMPPADWSIGNSLNDLLPLIEGTEIGICFDIGHANVAHAVDSFLESRYPLLNVHAHSNNGGWDEHLVVDQGTLDIKHVVSKLKKFYKGNFVIEARSIQEGIESRDVLQKLL